MVNIISPNVSNITSFKVHFNPRQEGSGDPSPENVREITGWNGVEGYISNVAQSYSLPSNTLTAAIDWTDDAGTIYGGYVDLISGELVQEYASITLTGVEEGWQFYGTEIEGGHIFSNSQLTNHIGGTQRPTEEFCTHFPMSRKWKTILNTCIVGESGLIGFTVDNSIAETVEEFTQFLAEQYANGTPVCLVYKIYVSYYASYTIHQLTPQQLTTLKGQNNFWSNADYVEIEYELTETFDIQKAKRKIILNQPHVESASGDIVTFDTDMKGKLKECRVYFSPVQEGEGDPSPDNVRTITGWNGVEGYSCGKNLFNMETAVEGYINTTGKKINPADQENMTSDFIPVIEGETYTWTHYPTRTGVNYWTGYAFYSNKDMDSLIDNRTTKNTLKPIYITVPANAKYIRIGSRYLNGGEAQLEKGSIENVSYEPYQATTTSIDWTDDAGTIYGGYVDLVSGELVAEYEYMTDTWGNWGTLSDCGDGTELRYKRFTNTIIGNTAGQGVSYCNVAKYSFNNANGKIHFYNVASSNNCCIYLPSGTDESLQIQVVSKLAEPIRYQLTPQQLTALRGTNTIYSNANEQIDIKYWIHFPKINYMKDV